MPQYHQKQGATHTVRVNTRRENLKWLRNTFGFEHARFASAERSTVPRLGLTPQHQSKF